VSRFVAFLLALVAFGGYAAANMILVPLPAVVSGYAGPGDFQAFTAYYALRGYSAAVAATGTQKAIRIRAASGPNAAASTDVVILTTGSLDVASAETFSGTDATCTSSSITTTTLTVGTCTANLTVGDRLTGTGVTAGTYIKTTGCTTTPASTCTVSISQTVSATTITAHGALFISTAYNQAGTTPCATSTACDLVQATADDTHQPILLTVCQGLIALPCIVGNVSTVALVSATTFTPNAAKIATYSWVGERLSGTNLAKASVENVDNYMGFDSAANSVRVNGGSSGIVTKACTDAAWHSVAGVANTTSSIAYCDGSAGTTGTATNDASAAVPQGFFVGSSPNITMYGEAGFADNVAASATVVGNLHTNQSAFWGTP